MTSLEKSIRKHITESADYADEDNYRHQVEHHRVKGHVHAQHATLYRDDTEDGRALKNYHSTRAILHNRIASAVSDLLDHVRNRGEVATPGQAA